ncbi:MAG: GAF domain-containing protein, partial [Candidatus Rokubacteria bacterium]|nr:GAF domain-containing protein [Candidatus Rokubacteria bacterium]
RVAQAAMHLLKAELSVLWLVDGTELRPAGWAGIEDSAAQTLGLPVEERLQERAAVERRVAIPDLVASADSAHPIADAFEALRGSLAVSLAIGSRLVGLLAVASHRPREFSASEERLLTILADHSAIAIENARHLKGEREARDGLASSEARYRELLENIIDIVYVHDLEGKLLAVNEAASRVSGYTREELLRMNIAQLMPPEELARQAEIVRRMIAGERVSEFFTAEFIRKDGVRGFFECSGRLIFKDGVLVAIEGVARDITARRKLEQRQAAFVEIVKELAGADDFERLFSLIGERVCRLMGTDSASFCVVEGDELVFLGTYGFDELLRAAPRRKISESRVGQVVLTRKPHASEDMSADPHWRDSAIVTQFGYRAVLEVPVILRGAVIGVLAALHKSPRTFSPEDVALLTSLADHAAVALDRTNLVRELKVQLQETQTLLTVSQAVNSTLDLTETLRRVARETAQALRADTVGAYLVDADRKYLHPIAGYHVPKHLLQTFLKHPIPIKGHPAVEEAWEHRRPVYSSNADADPRIDQNTLQRFLQRSVLFVPMVVKGEPIGGLLVTWWEAEHAFTPEELRLVEGISHQAAIAIDNSRLYRETREVAERLRLLGAAVASLGEVIVVTDREGQIIFVNTAIKVVFGYSPDEVVGKYASVLWAPSTPEGQMKAVMDATVAGGWQGEVVGIKADGSEFPVALTTGVVRDESGQPVALVGVVRDLTGEKALQAQLLQNEKLAALSYVLAGVGHELNNPLSVIVGQATFLRETAGDGALAQRAERIFKAAERCSRIVKNFLALARQHPPKRQDVSLDLVVQEAVELLAYPLRLDGVEVKLDLAPDLPVLWADPHQLHQVVVTLISNAHQAMRETPPPRRLSWTTRVDSVHQWDSREVEDTGPG